MSPLRGWLHRAKARLRSGNIGLNILQVMHRNVWQSCSTPPELTPGKVQVWRAQPSRLTAQLETLAASLTPDEQSRAAAFRFDKDRHLFIAGRGLLRMLLGRVLKLPPSSVELTATKLGRLELAERGRESFSPAGDVQAAASTKGEKDSRPRLGFNVSHSGDVVLIAVGLDVTLGVDVEQVRVVQRLEQLADHYFSPRECQQLFALPTETQTQAFFQAWTRKEAILKATGKGLSFPLKEVEVTLVVGEPAELLRYGHSSGDDAPWRLIHLDVGDQYVASLAVDRYPDSLCLLDYTGEHPA